jgi:hypothetical protein
MVHMYTMYMCMYMHMFLHLLLCQSGRRKNLRVCGVGEATYGRTPWKGARALAHDSTVSALQGPCSPQPPVKFPAPLQRR